MSYQTDETPEVAIAFREALEDLQSADPYAIENLTVIAQESTEFAQAISQELESHIKRTRPEFKLPALYLLDSIVKCVGTPYTVYLGRNLYRTFFDSFTVVDMNTRRAMEELFRAWKQPAPNSRDPRPVFPVDVTQPIDASLIKFRSVTLKAKQEEEQARMQKMRTQLPSRLTQSYPPRQSPTPTGGWGYQPPPSIGQGSNISASDIAAMMSGAQRDSTPNYPQPVRPPAPAYPSHVQQGIMSIDHSYPHHPQQNSNPVTYSYSGPPPPTMSHQARLEKLRADVKGLISSANAHLARNAYDTEKQKLLQNLKSLKVLLDGGQLTLVHIQSTEVVVASIAKDLPPVPFPHYPPPAPQISPTLLASLISGSTSQSAPAQTGHAAQPYAYPQPPAVSVPQYAPSTPSMPTPQPTMSVAQMMAILNPSAQNTPTLHAATPVPASTPSLLDQLRAQGLLGSASHFPAIPSLPTPAPNFDFLRQMQPSQVPAFQPPSNSDVRLDSASLKIRRPQLIRRLYEDRPDQCRQCGMRFPATDDGKKAKSNHLDWHFKTNSRVADSVKSAVNRSWYIDEREWIDYREQVDGISGKSEEEIAAADKANGKEKKDPKEQFVPVPTDLNQAKQPCSICQEKFEVEWHKELEQPVWRDAIAVGPKYYHATCFAEVVKGNAAAAASTSVLYGAVEKANGHGNSARSTPDAVLGKRTYDHFKQDAQASAS